MAKICYNCGIALVRQNKSVEHVPAKNVYEGYNEEFKKNRITVPACFTCNNLYSKIDQELRDSIAVKNEHLSIKDNFASKGIRSIIRKSNWIYRIRVNVGGKVIAVNFDYKHLAKIHIKNFKALFFRKYGFPMPSNFRIKTILDGDVGLYKSAKVFYDYVRKDKDWECSGHPKIFRFIIKDMTPDTTTNVVYESGDFEKLDAIVGVFVYHDNLMAIVTAEKANL